MKGKTKCQTRYDEAFFRESIQTLSSNEFTNESFAKPPKLFTTFENAQCQWVMIPVVLNLSGGNLHQGK